MKLEDYLKYRFGYCSVQKTGKCGGGCISQGETFQVTKEGNRKELIYVKGNTAAGVTLCFYHILVNSIQQNISILETYHRLFSD